MSSTVLAELWDTNRMRLLVEIERRGSLSAAAKAIGIGQPSASQHLRLLEAAAGQRLVERNGRGSRLTEAGRVLAGRALAADRRRRARGTGYASRWRLGARIERSDQARGGRRPRSGLSLALRSDGRSCPRRARELPARRPAAAATAVLRREDQRPPVIARGARVPRDADEVLREERGVRGIVR